jgi:outer membrane protein assembly factor BamB
MIIDKKVISPSKNFLHIFDIETGSLLFKEKFSTELSPIATNENIFLILDNDLLVCLNIKNGNIIYSYDLNQKIADFLRTKKKRATFKDLKILNSKLFIFLQNSYVIQLDLKGEIEEIKKLPSKIKTKPIILNSSIMYLDNKNKLSIIN